MIRLAAPMIAFSLTLTGCVTHRLVVAEPNPQDGMHRVSSSGFGWGAVQRRTVANCDSNLIDEVRVRQNFGQILASALTLGAWMPVRIEYRCAKRPSDEELIGAAPAPEAAHGGG